MRSARPRNILCGLSTLLPLAHAVSCPSDPAFSCSSEITRSADPCCVPHPAGLFIFRQRFEPDVESEGGRWGIDGLDVLDCTTQKPLLSSPSSSRHDHEEIGSLCLRSTLFRGEEEFQHAEREWAQSEVGEGVEEVWERAWNTAGRYVSTLGEQCEGTSKEVNVPLFFDTLHRIHAQLPTYRLLAEADITPSSDTTYSLSDVAAALTMEKYKPVITCVNTTLSTVQWPLNVRGPFQSAEFQPALDWSGSTNCPQDGILYPSVMTIPPPTPEPTWDEIRRPAPRPITKTHDESRLYYQTQVSKDDPRKLEAFRSYDEMKGDAKVEKAERYYLRDEL